MAAGDVYNQCTKNEHLLKMWLRCEQMRRNIHFLNGDFFTGFGKRGTCSVHF